MQLCEDLPPNIRNSGVFDQSRLIGGVVAEDPASNSLLPHRLAQITRNAGARLILVSTDCVFSGSKANYSESDLPDPPDIYGRSKLLGEVDRENCLTIRTSMIGRELKGSRGLLEWFLSQRNGRGRGFNRAIFSGLTTPALSQVILETVTDHPDLTCVWHVAGDPISKFDLLTLVKQTYGLAVEIEPDDSFVFHRTLNGSRFWEASGISSACRVRRELTKRQTSNMTPLRVAYDVSFLGRFFDRPGEQSGVYRVVEELLLALSQRDDIALNAVALCGDEPLFDSVKSLLYLERQAGNLDACFTGSVSSRFGLERLYFKTFAQVARADANGTQRARLSRVLRSVLYRLAYTYGIDKLRPAFGVAEFDVFHSPFPPLPPRELTQHVPRVITVYDLIFAKQPRFMPSDIIVFMQSVLRSIDTDRDWVTCISEFTKQEFCELTGMPSERVFVAPLAAGPPFRPQTDTAATAAAKQRYGIPEGDYFLAVGVLQPRKNLAHVIRCFLRLLEEQSLPDTYLVLAGGQGWMQDEIFTATNDSRSAVRERVIFTGHVANEDLAALYGGAIAFVYPSLYEGFGLPPLEAMACGTPVITSNTTALPEVAGDAAIMIDPTDVDALCQAMLTLAQNDGLRMQLREKGLQRATEFSWERSAACTVEAYKAAAVARLG